MTTASLAMKTTDNIEDARVFDDLKSLVAEVYLLKEANLIDGYSIKRNTKGSVMGVRIGSEWAYLSL